MLRYAQAGSPGLQYALGMRLIAQGKSDEGTAWLQQAADGGALAAVGRLGWLRAERDALDDNLLRRVRDTAALGEPRAIALLALRDINGKGVSSKADAERGRIALLRLAADAGDVELINSLAYGLAIGDRLTGSHPNLAAETMSALFAALPASKQIAAYVDSQGVALAAVGQRDAALAALTRAAELAINQGGALPSHLIKQHRKRIEKGEPITALTDAQDAGSFRGDQPSR